MRVLGGGAEGGGAAGGRGEGVEVGGADGRGGGVGGGGEGAEVGEKFSGSPCSRDIVMVVLETANAMVWFGGEK